VSAIPAGDLGPELATPLRSAFNAADVRRFGSHLATVDAEALYWRLSARVPVPAITLAFPHSADRDARKGSREAYFPETGAFVACDVLDRYALPPGARYQGPVLIEEREPTVVVGPSGKVEVDELGNLLITVER
jgi:N-methylhydantoinase A